MKLPSFSKLDLADTCQFAFSSGLRHPPFVAKPAMFGRAVASLAECIAIWADAPVGDIASHHELTPDQHDNLINAYVALCEELNPDIELDQWRKAELMFGFQLHTGKVRILPGFNSKNRWRRRKDEIVGIVDLVRLDSDGVIRVRDVKTGRYRMFTPPLEDLQLTCYGLAMSRLFKVDELMVEFCQVGDETHNETAVMDDFLLDYAWSRIHEIMAKVKDPANNIPKPGTHCKEMFCPVVSACPATQASIVAIDAASKCNMPMVPEIKDDDHARYLLQRLPAVKRALEQIEKALKERAATSPIDLGDGKIYGAFEESRKPIIVNDDSIRIIDEFTKGGADGLVERKISKTALKTAVMEVAPPRGGAALQRALDAALDEAGCLAESRFIKIRVGKRPKQLEESP